MKLRDMEYHNLYFESTKEKNKYVFGDKNNIGKAGYITRADTRPKMLSNFEDLVRNKKLKIKSIRLYDELRTFIYKNNKPQAMKGKNDDLVMSAAIGAWIAHTMTDGYSKNDTEMSAALLKGMNRNTHKISETNISPFYNSGMTSINPAIPVVMTDGLKQKLSKTGLVGKNSDFDWLF